MSRALPAAWRLYLFIHCAAIAPAALPGAAFIDVGADMLGVSSSVVAWADYDNDGDLDALVAGQDNAFRRETRLYRNDGNGMFTNAVENLPGIASGAVAWGDYDNDGWLDLLVTGQNSSFQKIAQLYRNNGDGTFSEVDAGLVGVSSSAVAWGDYDNDGRSDLLITGENASLNKSTILYRNTGSGMIAVTNSGLPAVANGAVAWGDYDNDGDLDLLITGLDSSFNWIARLYRNQGGAFLDAGAGLPGLTRAAAAWGDFNGDGRLDVVLTGTSGSTFSTRILRNQPGGSFVEVGGGLPGVEGSVAWGDVDSDGALDLLLAGRAVNPVCRIYRNANGVFSDFQAALTGVNRGQAAWGDYNNDGHLDVLLAGNLDNSSSGNGTARVFRNPATSPAQLPAAPAGLTTSLDGEFVVLSWAASPAEASRTVTYNVRVGTTAGAGDVIAPHAAANGFRRVPRMGNVQLRRTMRITGLEEARTYYWSVQTIDSTHAGGPFAAESSFVAPSNSPSILLQPQSLAVVAGGTAGFSVLAAGRLPIIYEWRRNGVALTNSMTWSHANFFSLPGVQASDAGAYTVVLSNAFSSGTLSSAPAVLSILQDRDGDGLPDDWEIAHGFDPDVAGEGDADTDGDGMSNAAEFAAGTDYNDAGSVLRLVPVIDDGLLHLQFESVSNRSYALEYRNSFGEGAWAPLVTLPASGTNRTAQVMDPGPLPAARYYRVATPAQ